MINVTYTKLRSGDWGVKGPASVVTNGASVTVTKKSGSTSRETVGRVLWSGNGIAIATIAKTRTRRNNAYASDYCGYPCPVTRKRCGPTHGPCHDCE